LLFKVCRLLTQAIKLIDKPLVPGWLCFEVFAFFEKTKYLNAIQVNPQKRENEAKLLEELSRHKWLCILIDDKLKDDFGYVLKYNLKQHISCLRMSWYGLLLIVHILFYDFCADLILIVDIDEFWSIGKYDENCCKDLAALWL